MHAAIPASVVAVIVGLPIRTFSSAKQRLAVSLTPDQRETLARSFADHVAGIADSLSTVIIATRDLEVIAWAQQHNYPVVDDGGSLNGAAHAIVAAAAGSPWLVLHTDLPWLTHDDLQAADDLLDSAPYVLAPSADGGTSLLAGHSATAHFAYGPGSFGRHLSIHPGASILVRPGLALDVDEPSHLTGRIAP